MKLHQQRVTCQRDFIRAKGRSFPAHDRDEKQAFVAHAAVEALSEAVLPWLPGRVEMSDDRIFLRPSERGVRDKLGSIVLRKCRVCHVARGRSVCEPRASGDEVSGIAAMRSQADVVDGIENPAPPSLTRGSRTKSSDQRTLATVSKRIAACVPTARRHAHPAA